MASAPNTSVIPPPASISPSAPIDSSPSGSSPPVDSPPPPSSSSPLDAPPPPSSSSSSAPPSSSLPFPAPSPPSLSPPPAVTPALASSPPPDSAPPTLSPPTLSAPSPPNATDSPQSLTPPSPASSDPPPPPDSRSPSAPSSSSPPPPNSWNSHFPPPPQTQTSPPWNSSSNTNPSAQLPRSPPNPGSQPDSASQGYNITQAGGSAYNNQEPGAGLGAGTLVGIGFALAFVLCAAALAVWFTKRKKKDREFHYIVPSPAASSQMSGSPPLSKSPSAPLIKSNSSAIPYSSSDSALCSSKAWFSYEELEEITGGFSRQNILGEGGFGCVYKGVLRDGREVAIKQLKVGGAQGEREFQAEVEIISRVHHRHLVSLVGYCISDNQRLLVYDYVPNKTLHHHLHGHGGRVLDWPTRIKVAAGAASGLAYLHGDCHPRIIHRDIKSSNILLDNNFEAQVADFGLAKLTVETNTHVSTRVMGTFGYLAPEYASTGKLTDKSDVFSFGVVLLELITGRKPVDTSKPLGEESLVDWARPLMLDALETNNVGNLPDPRLENNYVENEMLQMIEAASACVRYNASMRPGMGRVMRVLDNLADSMDINNGIRPGQTQVFNTGPNTQEIKNFQKLAFGSQDYSSDFSRAGWSHRDL